MQHTVQISPDATSCRRGNAQPCPPRTDSALIIAAHYDHLGIGRPVHRDSIYNGADDDASGVVAELEIEMIGRPDSLAGGPGRAGLTGYERSTMGDMLKASGSPIVPDPRPAQRFVERSDNIAFARRGMAAHTLSSFNLHGDCHQPSDEWKPSGRP